MAMIEACNKKPHLSSPFRASRLGHKETEAGNLSFKLRKRDHENVKRPLS